MCYLLFSLSVTILQLNQYTHFILLTMLLFMNLFWYKERVVKGDKIYCKSSIYAFVSNLLILTLSKVIDQHLLGELMNWAAAEVE